MNRISSIGSAFASTLLALAGLGHSDHAAAATLSVTNCNNEGQGSLREAVRIALSGDAIDLRHLPCPKITLIGAIMVQQPDLQFLGPGFRKLSVSGNRTSSVFRHPGGGALKLSGLTVEDGSWTDTTSNRALAEGGCIYSTGTVSLYDVEVRNCEAAPYFLDGTAQGGGIYAGGVTARFSAIYSNVVRGGYSSGGGIHAAYVMLYRAKVHHNHAGNAAGIYSIYGVEMDHSSISNNHALRFAGGFQTDYDAKITNSTISNNVAGREGGGFRNTTSSPSSTAIVNSTISGNVARDASAAYIVGGASVINSTIAFNRRNTMPGQHPTGTLSMGTDPTGSGTSHLLLISSILADNTVDGQPDIDFFVRDAQMHMLGEFSIVLSSNAPLPADTIRADPMLAPLADNGGRTWTHALLEGSPAIDHGNNEAGLDYDQRGTGFPRVKGAAPDIGSYER